MDAPAARKAGRVHHAVDSSEALDGAIDRRSHLFAIGDISNADEHFAAGRFNLLHGSDSRARLIDRIVLREPAVPFGTLRQPGSGDQNETGTAGRGGEPRGSQPHGSPTARKEQETTTQK